MRKPDVFTPSSAQKPASVSSNASDSFLQSADYKDIHNILSSVASLGISELVIRKGDASISLSAGSGTTVSVPPAVQQQETQTPAPEPHADDTAPSVQKKAPESVPADAPTINSPLAGTFYGASSPGKPAFVAVGDTVKAGDTVCIVEAMKLVNEISAPSDCKIVSILVEESQKVTKGQALIVIEEL